MTYPAAHRAKLHSTNPIDRLNGEIKRRTEVVGAILAILTPAQATRLSAVPEAVSLALS